MRYLFKKFSIIIYRGFKNMLYRLWKIIQFLLPYGLVLWIYRQNKALPTNIRTREGNNYKAIMLTEDYGLLFSEDKYVRNRGRLLLKQKRLIEEENNRVIEELNSLNWQERDRIYYENKIINNE